MTTKTSNGMYTVEFVDKGKAQKHKDCPDPTQYVTRNYSYEDAVTAFNPRIQKKSFFGAAEKAAQEEVAPVSQVSPTQGPGSSK
jgi:hypothetical protein